MSIFSAIGSLFFSLYKGPGVLGSSLELDEPKALIFIKKIAREIFPSFSEEGVYAQRLIGSFLSGAVREVSSSEDPRCYLVECLAKRERAIRDQFSQVSFVLEQGEVSYLETVKKISFYLRVERAFIGEFQEEISKENKRFIWEKVDGLVLDGFFLGFQTGSPSFTLASQWDLKLVQYVKILSFYPELQKKFSQFYEGIIGLEKVKISLFFEAIFPLLMPSEAASFGIFFSEAILLYGPPKCGRTLLMCLMAEALNIPILYHSLEISTGIEEVLEVACAQKNMLVFIKDASFIFPDNSQYGQRGSPGKAILDFFERVEILMDKAKENGVVLVFSSNYPKMINSIILSKIPINKQFYVTLPGEEERRMLFQKSLAEYSWGDLVDYKQREDLVIQMEGRTSLAIQEVIGKVARIKKKVSSENDILCCLRKKARQTVVISKTSLNLFEEVNWGISDDLAIPIPSLEDWIYF